MDCFSCETHRGTKQILKPSSLRLCGGFPKLGVPFGGPFHKDYSILGSILGSPYFGKLPCITQTAADDPQGPGTSEERDGKCHPSSTAIQLDGQ